MDFVQRLFKRTPTAVAPHLGELAHPAKRRRGSGDARLPNEPGIAAGGGAGRAPRASPPSQGHFSREVVGGGTMTTGTNLPKKYGAVRNPKKVSEWDFRGCEEAQGAQS